MNTGEFFVYYLMPPIVFVLSLGGNLMGLVVFFKEKLTNIGPVLTYKFIFITETIYLVQLVFTYLHFPFNVDFHRSRLACKLYNFFVYQGDAISSFLLAYIAIDKFVAIWCPSKRRIMIKTRNQVIFFICVLLYCSGYASIVPFCFDFFDRKASKASHSINETNSSNPGCHFVSFEAQLITSYLDLINRQLIPSILMICFSFLLILVIIKSRRRFNHTSSQQIRINRDVKLAINCFIMNFIFFACNTPKSLVFLIPELAYSDILNYSTSYIWFMGYGVNFYILLAFNTLFREKFWKLIRRLYTVGQ